MFWVLHNLSKLQNKYLEVSCFGLETRYKHLKHFETLESTNHITLPNPFEKISSSNWVQSSPNRGEHKKHLKPSPSQGFSPSSTKLPSFACAWNFAPATVRSYRSGATRRNHESGFFAVVGAVVGNAKQPKSMVKMSFFFKMMGIIC